MRLAAFLAIFVFSPLFGQDYEAQLAHRKAAIVDALEELIAAEEEVSLEFQCMADSRENAERFLRHHLPRPGRIEATEGQRFLAVVTFELRPGQVSLDQWLRTQFFIGIAYRCDMDMVVPVVQHNKSLKFVPGLAALHRTRHSRAA